MKKIKYFNKEIIGYNEKSDEVGYEYLEPICEVKALEYPCKNEEFDYWLDIIKKSYGEYGEVTYVDIPDIKTQEELQQEINSKLLKDIANQQLELSKQKELNATLLTQIAQLGGI